MPDDSSAGAGAHRIAGPTVAYWIGTTVALAGSLARGKIFAVSLGTSGVGVLAQLANLAAFLTGLSTLGLTTAGITLLGRESATGDEDRRRRIVSTIVVLPLTVSFGLAAAATVAARPLSTALLGSPNHKTYIILAAASVPANALTNSYQTVLQGLRRAWRTTINSALSAVGMVVVVTLLVVPFGLTGGAVSVCATSLAAAVVVLVRERGVTSEVFPFRRADADVNRMLMLFGSASLVAGSATSIVDLALRSALVHHAGEAANGVYQPAYLLGVLLFAQLGAGLVQAATPGLSAAWQRRDTAAVTAQVRGALQLSLLAMVPLILLGTAFRTVLIATVFSHAFAGAAPVLALALTSELPRAVAYAFGGLLLPAGRIRRWVSMGLIAEAARLAVSLALLDTLGARALAIGLLVDWLLIATATIITVHQLGVRIDRHMIRHITAACVVVAAAYASTTTAFAPALDSVALILTAAIWAALSTTGQQRHSARSLTGLFWRTLSRRR
ncbi:MAG TPA: polysaccharide biosynthesis C-terminal domain-containing protein [Acidothermaceae bacterium]